MPAVLRMNIHKNPGISQRLFVIPGLVRRHSQVYPKFSPALRRAPKLIKITPIVLLYLSSDIPVTLKACRNTLLGSDTLLKLTLLSLHSTSSQTLLESSRDWHTFCWWMHLEAEIEWTERYTWKPRLSEFVDALAGQDQVNSQIHSEAMIEQVCRCNWRPKLRNTLRERDRASL